MKFPEWDHPYKDLLSQNEFNEEDAGKYIAIVSGDIGTSTFYQKKIKNILPPDIDTCIYKGDRIDGEFVMRKHEGKRLFSIQMIKRWIRENSIEVVEEFQPSTPIAINYGSPSFSRQSNYLTADKLDRLSRKATLSMEEVVQIIHIRLDEKKWMTEEMLDTWDTINRRLAASGESPKKNQQIKSENILTIAACLSCPIPCKLVKWLQLPIEGVNWPKNSEAPEKNNMVPTDSLPEETQSHPSKSKTKLRAKEIGNVAKEQFNNPLSIPYGGKAKLRQLLCHEQPKLFTNSTFDKAWSKAKELGLVEVENVEQYKTGK